MEPREGRMPETRSIPELLGDLIRDMNGLVVTEGRLLRTELADAGSKVAAGAEMMVGGAVLVMVGLFVLVQALVIALADWLGAGLASLVVGGVLLVFGLVIALRGRGAFKAATLTPDRTVEQTRRDVRLIKEQL